MNLPTHSKQTLGKTRSYTVTIELENAAFDGLAAPFEVARILDGLSEYMNSTGQLPQSRLLDANGNTCGQTSIQEGGADDRG